MFRATLAGGRRERSAVHERIRGGAFAPARIAPGARNPDPTAPGVAGRIATRCALPGAGTEVGPPPAGRRVRAAPARARPAPGAGPAPRRVGGRGPGDGGADRRRPRPGSGPPEGGAAGPREAARGRHPRAGAGAPRGAPRQAGGGAGRGGTTGNPREGTVRAFEEATGQDGRFVEVAVPAIPVRAPEEPPPVRAVAPGSRQDRIVDRTEASIRSVERAGPEAFEGADGAPASPRIRVAVVVRWPGPRPQPGRGASGPCRPCRRFRGSTERAPGSGPGSSSPRGSATSRRARRRAPISRRRGLPRPRPAPRRHRPRPAPSWLG